MLRDEQRIELNSAGAGTETSLIGSNATNREAVHSNTAGNTIINMTAKAEEIRRILSEPVVDLWKLRELALSEGGLVNGKVNHHRYLAFFDVHHTNREVFLYFRL